MAIPVYQRTIPLRRPKGFEPVVQRWSAAFANRQTELCVVFQGAQGPDENTIRDSGFPDWIARQAASVHSPAVSDHARFRDANGLLTHIVTSYWLSRADRDACLAGQGIRDWWDSDARLSGPVGFFRESLTVPVERLETLYWQDYPGGVSAAPDIAIAPTPWCGYYGAMRDRIPLAAVDPLPPALPDLIPPAAPPDMRRARWRVDPPGNVAIIRSAASWERCDEGQTEDYMRDLRLPLDNGMDFLRLNPVESGCASLRFQESCLPDGTPRMETHALGYFLSLGHLEAWAEHHPSHGAIFSAAIRRYQKYGSTNQLRTWHEVYVPGPGGLTAEYVNCAAATGLAAAFEARTHERDASDPHRC